MINSISNGQSFQGAKLKVNKGSFGLKNIEFNLYAWQEKDVLAKLAKRLESGTFIPSSEIADKGAKAFVAKNGDTLVMHTNEKEFAEKLVLKNKTGNKEVSITPEGINPAVRNLFQSIVGNLKSINK